MYSKNGQLAVGGRDWVAVSHLSVPENNFDIGNESLSKIAEYTGEKIFTAYW